MANGLFNLKQVMQGIQQGGWNGQKPPAVEYLVVAGGGGAGYTGSGSGGGGGGGLLAGIDPVPNGQTLLVTVGSGGAGSSSTGAAGATGSNSAFGSITSSGGGGGGSGSSTPATSGGSGGGATGSGYPNQYVNLIFGQGISGQGNSGGNGAPGTGTVGTGNFGGGGGGASAVGLAGVNNATGNGGAGIASAISGTVTAYAGGGAGGTSNANPGVGGVGGGGNTGATPDSAGVAGTANTGGGGGGGQANGANQNGGAGGSGIVIVSYPDVYAAAASTTGSPTVSTSGSGSLSFNGSTYLNYGNQTALHLGSGSFTVEMWVYKNTNAVYMTACGDLLTGSGTNTFQIVADSTGSKIAWYDGASGAFTLTSTTSLATSTWYHVAVVRNSATITLYLNGVSEATATLTTNYNATTSFFVAQTPELIAGRYWNGYISNFRMVKGTAIYTGNFTPSTAPLTPVTNTSLLLNAVSGAYLADSSTNSFVPTVTGTSSWNQLSPFTGTGYKNRVYTWTSSGSITF